MGFKNKVVGFVAAASLSLSLVAGVSAAPNSGEVSGHVDLKQGSCGITMSVSNTDFGEFTWQQTGYVRTAGNPESVLTGTLYPAKPNGTCNVTVTTAGLVGPSDSIPTSHFSFNVNGGAYNPIGVDLPYPVNGATVPNVPHGSGSIGLKLDSVPNTFQPGEYEGTLKIGVTNGQ